MLVMLMDMLKELLLKMYDYDIDEIHYDTDDEIIYNDDTWS